MHDVAQIVNEQYRLRMWCKLPSRIFMSPNYTTLPDILIFPESYNPKEKNTATLFHSQNLHYPHIKSYATNTWRDLKNIAPLLPKSTSESIQNVGFTKLDNTVELCAKIVSKQWVTLPCNPTSKSLWPRCGGQSMRVATIAESSFLSDRHKQNRFNFAKIRQS